MRRSRMKAPAHRVSFPVAFAVRANRQGRERLRERHAPPGRSADAMFFLFRAQGESDRFGHCWLEQEFNSLDAQHDACTAYIASQRAEGWIALPTEYDDGGFSGGTLERPALQRLLADIEAGLVDVVVVYKIDRLSRSLMDFSKLVEVFDRNAVTFVSVTQSFNTTTSMGRLTLNILLSFAQFEREVIGEPHPRQVRGIAETRHVDGDAPLGYEVVDQARRE